MCKISATQAHKVDSERVDALKCSAVWCAFSLKQSLQYDTMMYIFPKAKQCNPRLPSVRLGAPRRCTYFLDYCPTIDKLSSLLYSLIFSSSTSWEVDCKVVDDSEGGSRAAKQKPETVP